MFTQMPQKKVVSSAVGQQQKEPTSRGQRMYAIAFDMDIESLQLNYGDPYNNAYSEIGRVLQRNGFTRQQGSVYFGNENINAVTCVLAAMEVSKSLPWFCGISTRYSDAEN